MPELDLGELQLTLRDRSHELHLKSSASFRTLDSTQNEEDLVRALLHGNARDRPWVSPCAPFQFNLRIHVQESISVEAHGILQQAVVRSIEGPQTWQPFGLLRKAIETSINVDLAVSTYSVSLSPVETRLDTVGRLPHKLGQDVPVQQVKPPKGLQSLLLDSVQLDMRLSGHMTHPVPTIDEVLDEEPLLDFEKASSSHTEMSEEWERGAEHSHDFCMLDDTLHSKSQDQNNTWLTPLLKLLDAGMRCVISADTRHLRPTVHLSSQVAFVRLDRLMPAVWAPGFLSEQAGKAKFLPTISHAVMSVAARQNPHSSLGAKCQEIQRRWQTSGHNLGSTAAIQLWRMLHQAATKKACGKRLQPLFSISATTIVQTGHTRKLDASQNSHVDGNAAVHGNDGSECDDILEMDTEPVPRLSVGDEKLDDWDVCEDDNAWVAATFEDEPSGFQLSNSQVDSTSFSSSFDLLSSPLTIAHDAESNNDNLVYDHDFILEP